MPSRLRLAGHFVRVINLLTGQWWLLIIFDSVWSVIRERHPKYPVTADMYPAFLYEGYYDPANPSKGLFQGNYLVKVWSKYDYHTPLCVIRLTQAFCSVFTSPSSAEEDGGRAQVGSSRDRGLPKTRPSVAKLLKLKTVDPRAIAYIACLVRLYSCILSTSWLCNTIIASLCVVKHHFVGSKWRSIWLQHILSEHRWLLWTAFVSQEIGWDPGLAPLVELVSNRRVQDTSRIDYFVFTSAEFSIAPMETSTMSFSRKQLSQSHVRDHKWLYFTVPGIVL